MTAPTTSTTPIAPAPTTGRVQLALNVSDLAARGRFTAAGLAGFDENDTTCCHTLQDKVWVHDPAGAPWEVYTFKDEDPAGARPATASLEILGGACCS